MTKLFIAPHKNSEQELFLISSHFNRRDTESTLFNSKMPDNFKYENFSFVEDVISADYILIPHNVKALTPETTQYLDQVRVLGQKNNKKIIVFIGGDMSHNVYIDDMIVFKGSQYKYLQRSNEIIVPPFVEDLSDHGATILRNKSVKATIGFCGWAGTASIKQFIKYHIKNFLLNTEKILTFNFILEVHKKGIYFRRKAIRILSHSKLIKTNFIIRNTFSASKKTISLDPAQARKEYTENILTSDFILAPKGDGNFSVRFYEVLTLSRIPLLIDTETVLPLEHIIDYSKFIVRVDYKDIKKLPEIISEFYSRLSSEEFNHMQLAARDAFRQYLRYDAFFTYIFSGPLERLLIKR
jgi:hypothetical protein